nr:type 4a pilus biogenesis protein PilO [Paenibacillus bovis]
MEKIISKKTLLISGILIIAFVLFTYLYFQVYKPINLDVTMLENEIQMEQKRLNLLEKKQNETNEPNRATTYLQQKIPVLPLQEQLILQLEMAAMTSNINISGMSFTDGETTQELEGTPVELPDGIELLTATLSIDAQSYAAVEKFIMELEALQRIIKIDHLSIKSEAESNIMMDLSVSAYYLPTLFDLQDEVPSIEIPTPASKTDPFK